MRVGAGAASGIDFLLDSGSLQFSQGEQYCRCSKRFQGNLQNVPFSEYVNNSENQHKSVI